MLVSGYNNIIVLPNCTMLYYVFSGPVSLRAYVPGIKLNNNIPPDWLLRLFFCTLYIIIIIAIIIILYYRLAEHINRYMSVVQYICNGMFGR